MQLQDFFDYKNKLMEDILTNDKIVHLINDKVSMKDAYDRLAYKQVFPYDYVPETVHPGLYNGAEEKMKRREVFTR